MRRSTRHVVIGGLAIVYGSILVLVWTWVFRSMIVSHLLVWAAFAVLFAIPILLLVTGSRLVRVTTTVSSGLRKLIVFTVSLLVMKGVLFGVLGGILAPATSNRGAPYAGIFGVVGFAMLLLVAAPSLVFAALLMSARKQPGRPAEAEDYDDELCADAAAMPKVEGRRRDER